MSRRIKNLKTSNGSIFTEYSYVRSKSANVSRTSSPHSQRSKSVKRSVSSGRRAKTIQYRRPITADVHHSLRQQQTTNRMNHRQCTQLKLQKTHFLSERIVTKSDKLGVSAFYDTNNNNTNSLLTMKSAKKKRKSFVDSSVNHQKQDIIQIFNEQKQLLEQHIQTMTTSSINTIKQTIADALESQEHISTKELENYLVQAIQEKFSKLIEKSDLDSVDGSTFNDVDSMLTQTIDKYTSSKSKNEKSFIKKLFDEQKQVLIQSLTQQSTTPSLDVIKQAVADALNERNSQSIITDTKAEVANVRKPTVKIINNDIKICADLSKTRIDAAFRQQRDTIVANRFLRDSVRQWSKVRSISSLVKKVQSCGTNDLENAWLIFCWISYNILFDVDCNCNTAENVFTNRVGTCEGFVNLYHEFCSLLNIPCSKISGYVKENFLKNKEDYKKHSHSWNAIVIDQFTYFVDTNWGARIKNNHNQIQDYYFLTSPEEFIYTHYSSQHQLLQPEITKQDFLNLPIMKSNYYRLNLSLLTPKQCFNQTNEHIFKISIRTPAYADLFASLNIDHIEYPCHLHTLCQRDINHGDIINCYLAPPADGLYEIRIYAKTNNETLYQDAIHMRLNVMNIFQAITFPITYESFHENKCILIEPFRRLVEKDECLLIQMIIPDAILVKIKNGDECIKPDKGEYTNGLLKKEICVHGDIHVCAQWHDKAHKKASTICAFNMI